MGNSFVVLIEFRRNEILIAIKSNYLNEPGTGDMIIEDCYSKWEKPGTGDMIIEDCYSKWEKPGTGDKIIENC